MKILMMIPLWGRAEVVRLFVQSLKRTLPAYAEVIPFFIISPEDEQKDQLLEAISGYNVFEYKNHPLGEKKNRGLDEALKLEWDYYMDMGSDNIWTMLMWEMYEDKFNSGVPYFGMLNIYAIDLKQYEARLTRKYHKDSWGKPTALGVGRCIRRDVVEDVMPLWKETWWRGMDGISHINISKKGYECDVIDNGELPVFLDIKTLANLTPFLISQREGELVDMKQVYEWFGLQYLSIYNHSTTGNVDFSDFREQVLKCVKIYGSQKEAFNVVNSSYEIETGEKRYNTYDVYRNMQTKKFKK